MAVRKRMVVPEPSTKRSADSAGMVESSSLELTQTSVSGHSVRTRKPSVRKQSIITSVSSQRGTPRNAHAFPLDDNADNTSARFVILLEPGTAIVALGGLSSGSIVRDSGKDMDHS